MERRRISHESPAGEEGDRASKRRKQSNEPRNARIDPQKIFDAVWNQTERSRNIRQHFEELPSREIYEDYYQKIANPISLHEIKTKLDSNQYASADQIKKDFLLMCENAATYNKAKSQIHNDSLRIKNLVESFFHVEEPISNGRRRDPEVQSTPGRPSRGSRAAPSGLPQPMVKIIDELLSAVGESGELLSLYFKALPSKKYYPDYFRVIQRPISLTVIRTKAKEGKYHNWSEFEEDVFLIRKNAEEYNAEDSEIVKDARSLEALFKKILQREKPKAGGATGSGIKLRLNVGTQLAQPQTTPEQVAVPKIKLNVGGKQAPAPSPTNATSTASGQGTPQSHTNGSSEVSQPTPPPSTKTIQANPQPSAVKPPHPVTPQHPAPPQKSPAPAMAYVPRTPRSYNQQPAPVAYHNQPPVNYNNHAPASANMPNHAAMAHAPANGMVGAPPRMRLDSVMHARSHSPPPGSLVSRKRSETPHSQAVMMSPPAIHHAQPHQHMGSTPGPIGYSPVPQVHRPVASMGPTSTPQPYQAHVTHHQEPTVRPEGHDKTNALIASLRITSTSAQNPERIFTKDFEPDDRKVTVQYCIHLPTDFETITLIPTLAQSLVARNLYIVRVHHSTTAFSVKDIQQAGQRQKNEPTYSVQLTPGVVNTIEVTAVTEKIGMNGANGYAAGVDRWEMERFRVFIAPLYQ